MHGPTVILIVFSIAGALVFAYLLWEKDREERWERDFGGVDEWERLKQDLGPRSVP